MEIYKINNIAELIEGNSYVGRGIVVGKTADAKKAAAAYFIMGRSANSRNRVFSEKENGEVYTEPFDASKVEDPSLITMRLSVNTKTSSSLQTVTRPIRSMMVLRPEKALPKLWKHAALNRMLQTLPRVSAQCSPLTKQTLHTA